MTEFLLKMPKGNHLIYFLTTMVTTLIKFGQFNLTFLFDNFYTLSGQIPVTKLSLHVHVDQK
jgi:nucleoside permease NupC